MNRRHATMAPRNERSVMTTRHNLEPHTHVARRQPVITSGRATALLALIFMCLPVFVLAQTDGHGSHAINDSSEVGQASTWKGALVDSLRLLVLEHTTRVVLQQKTRRELGGPFFSDYRRSVRMPKTWGDGDSGRINYVGHPIHGAASGFIWLDHEDSAHDPTLGWSKDYWSSRGRATAWAAAYSIQFEFGPLSEASIGNVGLRPNTTGWVDHVVTPAGALGFMVAEDLLDRHLIVRIESWTSNRLLRAVARTALNPGRTLSNAAQGKAPWSRPHRAMQ